MKSFSAEWLSPSNIALVKYWGKKEVQLPRNPSISFTLTECHTQTSVTAFTDKNGQRLRVWNNGKEMPSFLPKIETFLNRVVPLIGELEGLRFEINTRNTFPHGSGIASSASGMGALALCMYDIALQRGRQVEEPHVVSEMARLGSGSASRSVYGPLAVWGQHEDFEGSSDHYAIPFNSYHQIFSTYRDAVLIVDSGEKPVSSSVGHNLLEGHPFAESRYTIARKNMGEMKGVLEDGDLKKFVEIVENEAFMLHALMMTSHPAYMLMQPETLRIIELIQAFRREGNEGLCFTLDAGANVHMLYPDVLHSQIEAFLEEEIKQYCKEGYYICDRVGEGPVRLK